MSDVFLSYARADEDRAEIFREILEAEGWDVWWDREIRLGESWNDALEAALASSKVVVVLWTESSVTRDFVMREASYAAKHEKLIGVRLEPCEVDRDLAQLEMAELDGWQCEHIGWLAPGQETACFPSATKGAKTHLGELRNQWLHEDLPCLNARRSGSSGPAWITDKRKRLPGLVIRSLIKEARGLGPAEFRWQYAGDGADRGLIPRLRRFEPRMLLLFGDVPIFQPGQTAPGRQALTCIVLELPSEADSA